MGEVRASYPRFKREGAPLGMQLTEDDRAVLLQVYRHRFVRASDLYRLFPERTPDRLSRRLTLLFRHGYLDRPLAQVDRFREGGSASLVYGLGASGARTLKAEIGTPAASTDWKAKNRSYTRESLDHTLGVASFLIDIELACRGAAGFTYLPPDVLLPQEAALKWSVPVSWRGNFAEVLLIPDAVFGLIRHEPDRERRASFFLEYDRGTMTIAPSDRVTRSEAFLYRSSVLRKFIAYAESYRRKLHPAQLPAGLPRLLTITSGAVRAAAMRKAAAFVLEEYQLPAALFLFGTPSGAPGSFVDAAGAPVVLLVPAS